MMKTVVLLVFFATVASAFQARKTLFRRPTLLRDVAEVDAFLTQKYPDFMRLLLPKNDDIWKKLREADEGYTIFAPNNKAFADLGEKRREQLEDVRNSEAAEKMGAYHVINEPVTADALFASGGVITLGGEIPVGRSTSGGFFGIGGKEDGGVTVNGAKVVDTFEVDKCIVHEVDSLVSPELLWRYCDQLRIPGSR